MSEETAAYQVKTQDGIKNLKVFASHGLEILKHSVLLVLYQQSQSPTTYVGCILSKENIREHLGLPPVGEGDNLICGVLEYLLAEKSVKQSSGGNHWAITEKGISMITLAQLEDEIIQVLLKNAREHGRHACMRPSDIGRKIGTYRKEPPSSDDTFGRVHHKLLRKLQNERRVEPLWNESCTRRRWRLTDAEWNRLTLDE